MSGSEFIGFVRVLLRGLPRVATCLKTEQPLMKNRLLNPSFGGLLGMAAMAVASTDLLGASDLQTPFRVESNGKPIDMNYGNAAPCVVDFDGDGNFDLLVGQRGECKLMIFKNIGSNSQPKFGPAAWFRAGGVDASLPGG
jgi:hypothetical protein